jgi:hypothetical protein
MFSQLTCRLFGHRRSRTLAHLVDGVWHSRCKRCRVRVYRVRKSNWREVEDVD